MDAATVGWAGSIMSLVFLLLEAVAVVWVGVTVRKATVWWMLGSALALTVLARVVPALANLAGLGGGGLSVGWFVIFYVVPGLLGLASILCLLGAVYFAARPDGTPRAPGGVPAGYEYPSAVSPQSNPFSTLQNTVESAPDRGAPWGAESANPADPRT